jgi:REP element-mobilizing transposase RayT
MAGDNYFIRDQHAKYFLKLTVINWIDAFSRKELRDIVVDSLNFCSEAKGLDLYAWVIMSNHVHLVASCKPPHRMSDFLRDFKKFTSKKIVEMIQKIPESRKDWLLDKFSFEARRTGRARDYKFWTDGNHAIDLDNSNIDIIEKISYIHDNPVRAGLVRNADDYLYSSACDYSRKEKGLVKIITV